MAVDRELGAGSWSYFGDARAISHGGDTFTGWISTTGNVWVARYTSDGKLTKRVIFKGLGRDDHNNPSLIFRRDGHIIVFFSPHSGHHLPPPGTSRAGPGSAARQGAPSATAAANGASGAARVAAIARSR